MIGAWRKLHDATRKRGRSIIEKIVDFLLGFHGLAAAAIFLKALVIPGRCHHDSNIFFTYAVRSAIVKTIDGISFPHGRSFVGQREIIETVLGLNNIVTIRAARSFAGVARLAVSGRIAVVVRVGARPLDVNEIVLIDGEIVGKKVIFDGRKRLDDVAALAAHIQIEHFPLIDFGGSETDEVSRVTRSIEKSERVTPVLERATELSRIDCQAKWYIRLGSNRNRRILRHRRTHAHLRIIIHTRIRLVRIVIVRGDVVAKTEDALLVLLLGKVRQYPRVVICHGIASVTKVIHSTPRRLATVRSIGNDVATHLLLLDDRSPPGRVPANISGSVRLCASTL